MCWVEALNRPPVSWRRKKDTMSEQETPRRTFLKTVGAIGAGSMVASLTSVLAASGTDRFKEIDLVPTRPFGKTGENVSILALGGVLGLSDLIVFSGDYQGNYSGVIRPELTWETRFVGAVEAKVRS